MTAGHPHPHPHPAAKVAGCTLCERDGGVPVWAGAEFRLIRALEAGFPGFYRVVWTGHVAEFSDLSADDRTLCMDAVALCEKVLRAELRPDKINLAALGNMVPHLHWHLVARFEGDSHFPAPIWAAPLRPRDATHEAALTRRLPVVDAALRRAFADAFADASPVPPATTIPR